MVDTVEVTVESYCEALKWWNNLTKEQQDKAEQDFIKGLSPQISKFAWASREWKIHQLYWVGRK